jgi:MFS family permease
MSKKVGLLSRNTVFKHIWLAKTGSILGGWFNQVALGQITLTMTGSPTTMGLVLLSRSLPNVVLGPFISPLVDGYSKKTIMYISDVLRTFLALIFPVAYMTDSTTLLYLGALLLGIAGIMFNPAQQAVLPSIVDKDDLAEANAINSGTSGIVSIIGAIIGGIVASFFHPVICFIINALSYVWSAFCIYKAKWKEKKISNSKKQSYIYNLEQGFIEVSTNKAARAIIIIGISWGFAGGGYAILIPILGQEVYDMGGLGIGMLYAIDGLGMLLGAFYVKQFIGPNHKKAIIYYGGAYLTQALFFAFMTQFSIFILGAFMLLLMRISSGIITPLDSYLLQFYTPDEVRGRVFSLHSSTYLGVMQISYASLGYLVERFGVPTMGIVIGIISFICGLTWLIQMKYIFKEAKMKIDTTL